MSYDVLIAVRRQNLYNIYYYSEFNKRPASSIGRALGQSYNGRGFEPYVGVFVREILKV